MRSRSPERKHVGGDWATWITSLYVTASAFQSWPFPVCSQAAHYGCGCWAENACNMSPYSTAVSTSGIPRTLQLTAPLSLSQQLWIPHFLFTSSILLYITELMSIQNRSLMWVSHLPLMRAASQRLIMLSDGQPFLPSDSHHSFPRIIDSSSAGLVSQLRARCIEEPFGFAVAFDMGHLLQIWWEKYVFEHSERMVNPFFTHEFSHMLMQD